MLTYWSFETIKCFFCGSYCYKGNDICRKNAMLISACYFFSAKFANFKEHKTFDSLDEHISESLLYH